jgi:lipid-A-disaccharide synthase
MLLKMIEVEKQFPNCDFVIAGVDALGKDFYQSFLKHSNIRVVFNKTYELFDEADAALVSSGTATLETALFNVPQVVCYQTSWFSFKIAQLLVAIKYISLVNLISDKEVVKELIQDDLTVTNMVAELKKILSPAHNTHMLQQYAELRTLLGGEGASERVAKSIYNHSSNS